MEKTQSGDIRFGSGLIQDLSSLLFRSHTNSFFHSLSGPLLLYIQYCSWLPVHRMECGVRMNCSAISCVSLFTPYLCSVSFFNVLPVFPMSHCNPYGNRHTLLPFFFSDGIDFLTWTRLFQDCLNLLTESSDIGWGQGSFWSYGQINMNGWHYNGKTINCWINNHKCQLSIFWGIVRIVNHTYHKPW